MALGFGFNKTKVLASAEKYVQQGKFQNAITEYQKVTKQDPKDLTVLNTIGDLYSRLGQSDQAILYFKKVGDTYANDGFTVKAIAMYKKITKLTPTATDCILKLAEMYTQQGLYNDARAQYMQLAEASMRAGDLPSAAKIFQKMLELDPENAAMQSRLADIYMRIGKKGEARNIFLSAAKSLFTRGAYDAADEALGKVLGLDAGNAEALMLRGRVAADGGNAAAAIGYLEQVADLDSRADALHVLLRAQIMQGHFAEAEPIAKKLLTVHNDNTGVTEYAEALLNAGDYEAALRLFDQHADRLLSADPSGTILKLHGSINRIQENPRALEILLSLYRRAGESTHVGEVMELLAHAYVQEGNLAKARDLYSELAQREPENELHSQHYRQIVAKLGDDPAAQPLSEEQGKQAFMVDELEMASTQVMQEYPEEVAEAVTAAITDSELLDSYNLPQKAIQPLEAVLDKAPRDVRLNQRLASLYARANRWDEAASCCAVLQSVFGEAGHEQEAAQYADMAAKYRERAGVPAEVSTAAGPAAAEFTPKAPAMDEAPSVPEFNVGVAPSAEPEPIATAPAHHEIDLSDEWESVMTPPAAAPAETTARQAATPVAEVLEKARFYVSQSMWQEALGALARAAAIAHDDPGVNELRQQLAAATATSAPAADAEPTPSVVPEPLVAPEFAVASSPLGAIEPEAAPRIEAPPPVIPPPVAAPAPAMVAASVPAASPSSSTSKDALGDFISGLDEALGDDFDTTAPPPKSAPAVPAWVGTASATAPAIAASASSPAQAAPARDDLRDDLSDIFAEFKEGVEEGTPQEDPQTHFNLGVAFKEMGLLDEAIGELQKVCHAIDRGSPFTDRVQAYTLLANCFVEKGVGDAAVKWLEKALTSPGLDDETILAIHYEMASVYETAGNRKEALRHFMEVYGSNIDYRDVAERIKALKA
jgi:pilus assembly protein FimV